MDGKTAPCAGTLVLELVVLLASLAPDGGEAAAPPDDVVDDVVDEVVSDGGAITVTLGPGGDSADPACRLPDVRVSELMLVVELLDEATACCAPGVVERRLQQ